MKKAIIIILLILAAGSVVVYYNWNRKNENLADAKPVAKTTSAQLFGMFEQDEPTANKTYLDKVVEVKGVVREVRKESTGEIVLTLDGSDMFGVICRMDPEITMEDTSLVGKDVVLKGLCTGMLMDVVLVRCVFTEV